MQGYGDLQSTLGLGSKAAGDEYLGIHHPRELREKRRRAIGGQAGKAIILLLCGGSKRTQRQDIDGAVGYWNDYLGRR